MTDDGASGMTTRKYKIGDAVTLPDDFCPGCQRRTGPITGLVTGHVVDGEQSALFADEPGPFYTVLADHEHNGTGHLVYAEAELNPAPRTQGRKEA